MSLQAALKTLEELRSEAQTVRDRFERPGRLSTVYDHWAGREAALADAIAELTKAVRPISVADAGFPNLGEQLQRDYERRTVATDLAEDR